MSIAGTIYGVALNDRDELDALGPALAAKPYLGAPRAPIVYVKPASTLGPAVAVAPDAGLVAASTVALLFARDAARVAPEAAWSCVGASCLALDLALPQENYYRPPVAGRLREGSLRLGMFAAPCVPDEIRTRVDGAPVHRWSTGRLVRPVATLIADLSAFMTLRAGDVLLVGLPGDAPQVRLGQHVAVEADGLPALASTIEGSDL